jgi:hypothetical protein
MLFRNVVPKLSVKVACLVRLLETRHFRDRILIRRLAVLEDFRFSYQPMQDDVDMTEILILYVCLLK